MCHESKRPFYCRTVKPQIGECRQLGGTDLEAALPLPLSFSVRSTNRSRSCPTGGFQLGGRRRGTVPSLAGHVLRNRAVRG
jgi:hypothetical protein